MNIELIMATSFMAALSGALTPGPLLTVTMIESMRRGLLAGPFLILGHSFLEFLLVLLLLSGLKQVLLESEVIILTGALGAVVLLVMGILTLKNTSKMNLKIGEMMTFKEPRFAGAHLLVLKGMIISLSNPYWLIWWISIGGAFLSRVIPAGFIYILTFYIGHILADFAWYTFVSAGIHFGKTKVSQKLIKTIYGLCGIFLLSLSGYFAYDSISRLY